MRTIKWPRRFQFDPSNTFECGQAFRWSRVTEGGHDWQGIISGLALRVNQSCAQITGQFNAGSSGQESVVRDYFSCRDDLQKIICTFPRDGYLDSAKAEYAGLRLLTQDPWECLLSFVCSINCNIPSIRFKIGNLCRRFGKKIDSEEAHAIYSFPDAKSLSKAEKKDLLDCKVGFRWKYIQYIARKVALGELDLKRLEKMSYDRARSELISETSEKTFGVGPKVADCVLLFSLRKFEAFPIDVWMIRCLAQNYPDLAKGLLPEGKTQITPGKYFEISAIVRKHFGNYAGYAQQYLYMKTRNDARLLKIERRFERKRKL
ncbi:MAG: DNA-3-methyladenine glycosylase family protein [Nitrososphaerales archaeon]